MLIARICGFRAVCSIARCDGGLGQVCRETQQLHMSLHTTPSQPSNRRCFVNQDASAKRKQPAWSPCTLRLPSTSPCPMEPKSGAGRIGKDYCMHLFSTFCPQPYRSTHATGPECIPSERLVAFQRSIAPFLHTARVFKASLPDEIVMAYELAHRFRARSEPTAFESSLLPKHLDTRPTWVASTFW